MDSMDPKSRTVCLKHVSIFASLTWGITLGLRGVVYQADLPSTAGSWPHHKHPASREKSSAQLHFHLTYLTPLPGITAPAPLTAFSWPAVWFVYLTFCLEISLGLTGIWSLSVIASSRFCRIAVVCTVKLEPIRCDPERERNNNSSPLILKHRNWYPSSSTSQRCLSTAMATIWGWGKTGSRFATWNCQPGPRNPKTLSGSTGW